jgi:UDPglucose 6-dehydrogenase
MNLSLVSEGYVGLAQCARLADAGNHVVCTDIDEKKFDGLRKASSRPVGPVISRK